MKTVADLQARQAAVAEDVPADPSASTSQSGTSRLASQRELDTIRMVSNLVAGVEARIIFGASSYGALDTGKRLHSEATIILL
jgi:hypothetical protein